MPKKHSVQNPGKFIYPDFEGIFTATPAATGIVYQDVDSTQFSIRALYQVNQVLVLHYIALYSNGFASHLADFRPLLILHQAA
jgi:hypothetical protein